MVAFYFIVLYNAILMDHTDEKQNNGTLFRSLHTLRQRWKDGTFGEILDDWRWIFTYTKRYRYAVVFYTLLGILSTTMGLVAIDKPGAFPVA